MILQYCLSEDTGFYVAVSACLKLKSGHFNHNGLYYAEKRWGG